MLNFIDICKLGKEELKVVLEQELKNRGYSVVNEDGFLYAEGTYPVMLIAHMDTVHHDKCTIVCTSEDGKYIMSPQGIGGDDRCGIYMILKTIDEINCSVVFTEDEEVGCIGASKFAATKYKPKNLNYIIEYDRKGKDDAVFYDCDNPEFTAFVTDPEIGFKEEHGSCSDISRIAPALGVAAVNISSGYYNQHTCHEYVNVAQMENNIVRGKKLILKPCEKPFEYIEKKWTYTYTKGVSSRYNGYGYGYGGYYDDWYDEYYGVNGKNKKKNITVASTQTPLTNESKVEYNLPEPPFSLDDVLEYGCGMALDPVENYLMSDGEKWTPDSCEDYLMDASGVVYKLHENTGFYYPLIAGIKAYDATTNLPLVYDHVYADEFVYGFLADLEEIDKYAEKLVDFDLEHGTDFESEFYDEIYMWNSHYKSRYGM